jgi:hypothetical protein
MFLWLTVAGYIEALDREGVVPFGVPISAILIGVLILQSLDTPLLR